MQLSLQNFTGWVSQQAAAIQSSASAALNLTVGSVLRAIIEANASVALWMQWLILLLLQVTRAATSVGSDLDTWMADFGVVRETAVAATGSVTFSRFSVGQTALIVPYYNADGTTNVNGVTVKTADGTEIFGVATDSTNALWNAGQGGYLVPAATASATVLVQAQSVSSQGNVGAGTISLLASGIAGIDTVTNAVAFTNGIDAETDAAFRARFTNFINTRSQATVAAVGYAVSSIQQGITYAIAENQNVDGSPNEGHFIVSVDDGSGNPPASLLNIVRTAIEAVRPLGSTYAVQGPTLITATVSFTITAAINYVKANLDAAAETAVTAAINALPMNAPCPYNWLSSVIFGSAPGIANVTALQLNGGTADIGGGVAQVVRVASVSAN